MAGQILEVCEIKHEAVDKDIAALKLTTKDHEGRLATIETFNASIGKVMKNIEKVLWLIAGILASIGGGLALELIKRRI